MLGKDLLQGEKVCLTEIRKEDLSDLAHWHNDMEYQRLLRRGMVSPVTVEGIEHWIHEAQQSHDEMLLAIRTLSDHKLIGMISLKDIMWQARHCSVWIGIGNSAMRGKGYGTDAMRVMLKYAFMELNMNRVGLEVASYNPRARASYEKCGFKLEGTMRQYLFRDGQYYDMHLMSLLYQEWESK